ncbi:MAG: hypothetical protein PHY45_00185 [Rhodocyclaceae bacterium]|nr:hypothetical protein [Rhodocyclaceae bacterium]
MGTTMVTRRIVGYVKAKKSKIPQASLPRQPSSDEMAGDQAKSFVPRIAPAPRQPSPYAGWRKFLKSTAIVVGVVVCGALAYWIGKARPPSYDYADTSDTRTIVTSMPSRAAFASSRAPSAADQPGMPERTEAVVQSRRAASTDESFLAAAYVRRKASLSKLSGVCNVQGSGSRDLDECLRRLAQK